LCGVFVVSVYLFFFSSRRRHTRSVSAFLLNRSSDLPGRAPERFLPLKITCRRSDVMSKGKKRSGARPGRPQPLRGTKGKRKGAQIGRASCRGRGRSSGVGV